MTEVGTDTGEGVKSLYGAVDWISEEDFKKAKKALTEANIKGPITIYYDGVRLDG